MATSISNKYVWNYKKNIWKTESWTNAKEKKKNNLGLTNELEQIFSNGKKETEKKNHKAF